MRESNIYIHKAYISAMCNVLNYLTVYKNIKYVSTQGQMYLRALTELALQKITHRIISSMV